MGKKPKIPKLTGTLKSRLKTKITPLFFLGFVEELKRGHDTRPPNYKSLVLLRAIVKSSLGAAMLGAKSVNEKFSIDYSKNTESFLHSHRTVN